MAVKDNGEAVHSRIQGGCTQAAGSLEGCPAGQGARHLFLGHR